MTGTVVTPSKKGRSDDQNEGRRTRARTTTATYKRRNRFPSRPTADIRMIRRYLAKFYDPFSNATLQPKIPDGKAVTSASIIYQKTQIINIAGGEKVAYFVSQPVATVPLFCLHDTIVNNGTDDVQARVTVTWLNPSFTVWEYDATAKTLTQAKDHAIARWRVCSQGMHLACQNQTDKNDGWWEAWRLTTSGKRENIQVGFHGATNIPVILPIGARVSAPDNNIEKQASYTQGRVRDIHKVAFINNPNTLDHDFTDCYGVINTETPGWTNADNVILQSQYGRTEHATVQLKSAAPVETQQLTFLRSLIDLDYDTVVCKINGRAADNINDATSIMAYVIQNLEVCYDEDALNQKFETRQPTYKYFWKANAYKRSQVNAATKVSRGNRRGY